MTRLRALAIPAWLLVAQVAGCSHAQPEPSRGPTADGLYFAGEQAFKTGQFGDAIDLFRHALLQLPPTAAADELRHKLILRMAYVMMVGYANTRDGSYLLNGKTVLERYLNKHEELLGDSSKARQQRGEVYEILFELEKLQATALHSPAPSRSGTATAAAPPVALPAAPPAKRTPPPSSPLQPPSDTAFTGEPPHRGYPMAVAGQRQAPRHPPPGRGVYVIDDRPERRTIRVGRWNKPDVNDPLIRARLRSSFTNPFLARGIMLKPKMFTPPRPLLRQRGVAELAEKGDRHKRKAARDIGRKMFVDLRPELKRCYEAAFARSGDKVAPVTVEVSLDKHGALSRPRILEGRLADPLGDACLLETLENSRLEAELPQEPLRIRVSMMFFWQGPVWRLQGGDVIGQRWLFMPSLNLPAPAQSRDGGGSGGIALDGTFIPGSGGGGWIVYP